MATEANKAIARRDLEEVWGDGNLATVDELYASDVIDHNPLPGQAPGREGVKQVVAMVSRAFPGEATITGMIAEGDTVARWETIRGRHEGEFMGMPATHKPFTLSAIDVLRIVDEKIVEMWHQEDMMGLMQQL